MNFVKINYLCALNVFSITVFLYKKIQSIVHITTVTQKPIQICNVT